MYQASTSSPVVAAIATNRPSYRHGQSVRSTLVLQNVSESTVDIVPNAKTDGITVSKGSTVILAIESGRSQRQLLAARFSPAAT